MIRRLHRAGHAKNDKSKPSAIAPYYRQFVIRHLLFVIALACSGSGLSGHALQAVQQIRNQLFLAGDNIV